MSIPVRADHETYSVLKFLAEAEDVSVASMLRLVTLSYCVANNVQGQLAWRYESANSDHDRWVTKYPCTTMISDVLAAMTAAAARVPAVVEVVGDTVAIPTVV